MPYLNMILINQRKVPCSERKLHLKLMRTNCVAFLLIFSEDLFLPVSIELEISVESAGRWGMGPPNEWIPENNLRYLRCDHISSCFVLKSTGALEGPLALLESLSPSFLVSLQAPFCIFAFVCGWIGSTLRISQCLCPSSSHGSGSGSHY